MSRNGHGDGMSREDIEQLLCELIARRVKLDAAAVHPERTFESYGLGSADAVALSGELESRLGRELSPTLAYDHPTIRQLAEALSRPPEALAVPDVPAAAPAQPGAPVAVIGVGCRFPAGGDGPRGFWEALAQGRHGARRVPEDRWDAGEYLDPDPAAPGKAYTQDGGFVEDVAGFDADLFGLSPAEALRMDPQQRMLLELAWAAAEDAGVAPDSLRGTRTGVFVGLMETMQYSQVQLGAEGAELMNDPFFAMGAAASVAAGRIAYLLDLHGPAVALDTACSSSLVAAHLAVQSLRRGECDLALVGGASLIAHPQAMVQACKMGMLARDGRVKAFDAAADGFLIGEGCGVVLLARLDDALAQRRPVRAVIRGTAVNQDGRSNGITAPSRAAQSAVIRSALADARVDPDGVDYVEAHGSGTSLGDAIEVAALRDVFGERAPVVPPLTIGSVKTNLGHLQAAAGVAGLVKTVLMLEHAEVPRTLHLEEVNPALGLDRVSIQPAREHRPWPPSMRPRRAGVSSFGWSGTNAHAVLEAPPPRPVRRRPDDWQVLTLSAATATALTELAARLADRLEEPAAPPLEDVAYTLATGRARLAWRRAVVCRDAADAARRLRALQPADAAADASGSTVAFAGDADVVVDATSDDREAALRQVADLWERGAEVDWSGLFSASARAVSLPAYPFQHTRFWPEPDRAAGAAPAGAAPATAAAPAAAAPAGAAPATEAPSGKRPDLADWAYAPVWREDPPGARGERPAGPWLVLADGAEADAVVEALRERGEIVTSVRPGDRLDVRPGGAGTADPRRPEHVSALVEQLVVSDTAPRAVLHAWTLGAPPERSRDATLADLDRGLHSVLALAQALAHAGNGADVDVIVATRGAADVTGAEPLAPGRATLPALCRCLRAEQPALRLRAVDVEDAGQLLAELQRPDGGGAFAAWRGRRRWLREHVPAPVAPPAQPVWRDRGTYLITGGLGGLGLVLARHLARTVRARLVLVGRHAPPERVASVVAELEALGAEVAVFAADVADADALAQVVAQARERFGPLHGAVHAAGVPGGGLFQRKTREQVEGVLRPKVLGTIALTEALAGEQPDFVAFYSSSAAALGGIGESDYAAANAFMDAWAGAVGRERGLRAVSIGWGAWQRDSWQERIFKDVPQLAQRVRDYRDRLGIADSEGVELLERVVASGHESALVLSQDPESTRRAIAEVASVEAIVRPARQVFPRPELRVPYRAPRREVERQLARIWSEQLGIEQVGVDDPFFELGGNSLIGLSIIARVGAELDVALPAAALFERPTIAELADLIGGTAPEAEVSLEDQAARGDRRRQMAGAARRRRARA